MNNTMLSGSFYAYRWWLFALASLMFFAATAITYASIGVALPYMINDFGWTQAEAGVGFSLLALANGLTAALPAILLKRFGLKVTYLVAGITLVAGGVLLASTTSLTQYYGAAILLGTGICLCGSVSGVQLVNSWLPDKQSFAIGALFMIAGLGGVAGPLIASALIADTGNWSFHFWVMAGGLLALSILSLAFIKDVPKQISAALAERQNQQFKESNKVHRSETHWQFGEAIRTPQFYIITLSLTLILLSAVTMSTWAFTHMTGMGIAAATAAAVLSLQAVANSMARLIGGAMANTIDPKWLLVSAIVADIIGMLALSYGDSYLALALFILGDGYGFGMCYFASTMLMVNYYGAKASPEILSTMNFLTTLAMIGPVVAGVISDNLGGFAWAFRACAILLGVLFFAVIAMRPPLQKKAVKTVS